MMPERIDDSSDAPPMLIPHRPNDGSSCKGLKTYPESLMRTVIGPNDHRVIHSLDHKRNFRDAIRTGQPNVSPIEVAAHDEIICQMCDTAVEAQAALGPGSGESVRAHGVPDDPAVFGVRLGRILAT
jgi:hypothetical protein